MFKKYPTRKSVGRKPEPPKKIPPSFPKFTWADWLAACGILLYTTLSVVSYLQASTLAALMSVVGAVVQIANFIRTKFFPPKE